MTLTRQPSGRRASQIGLDSSTRRPTWLTMRWQIDSSWELSRKRISDLDRLAADFDEGLAGAVDHDVGDVVAGQQRLQRTVAQHVVADVLEQFFLLGDRHREVLDGDDVVDDIADFLARAFGIELGKLRKVDRIDERGEDLRSWYRSIPRCGRGACAAASAIGGGADLLARTARAAARPEPRACAARRRRQLLQPAGAAGRSCRPGLAKPSFPRFPNMSL